MARRWNNRTPQSPIESAAIIAADFAAECKRQGDLKNYYRWRMIVQEYRAALYFEATHGAPPPSAVRRPARVEPVQASLAL